MCADSLCHPFCEKNVTHQEYLIFFYRKEEKKLAKLRPKIAFFEGRKETDQAEKIRGQIEEIQLAAKARYDAGL